MKRPEGFDQPKREPVAPPSSGTRPTKPTKPVGAAGKTTSSKPPRSTTRLDPSRPTVQPPPRSEANAPTAPRPPKQRSRNRKSPDESLPQKTPDRSALKKAARARKRYERKEVKRFTRRSRSRRVAWLSALGLLVTLVLLVTAAVFSPVLSLKTITVQGASRVSATDIESAVKDQLGTPLALLDTARIKQELARFPLIRSYVTEAVPPNTLVIHIVERAPVASITSGSGFTVVDPAGITISKSSDRPAGLPLIDVADSGTKSAAFTAAVEVLLALPQPVLAQVDTVTAHTTDDVAFSLTGVGQTVVWGSAERSDQKARVLAGLIKNQNPNKAVEYDVSAPGAPVVRPS